MTKERYKDWIKNPIRKNYFVILWIALIIFIAFMLIDSILNGDVYFSAFSVLLMAFCIYRGFFRVKVLFIKQFNAIAANQGATEWERAIQFTDCITVIDGNTTTQYQWNQIVELKSIKNYLVLVFKNKSGIRLDKNGFTKGDCDSFLQYVKDKYHSIY